MLEIKTIHYASSSILCDLIRVKRSTNRNRLDWLSSFLTLNTTLHYATLNDGNSHGKKDKEIKCKIIKENEINSFDQNNMK